MTLINKSGEWSPNERFFDQKASIAYEYNGIENVNMLQILVTLKYGGIEVAAPYPLQLFIWYVVCPFAELLGYRGAYPEYIYPWITDIEALDHWHNDIPLSCFDDLLSIHRLMRFRSKPKTFFRCEDFCDIVLALDVDYQNWSK